MNLGNTTETRTYNSYGEEQSYTVKFNTTPSTRSTTAPGALGRTVTQTETRSRVLSPYQSKPRFFVTRAASRR